jgi:hypothetical protein
MDTVFILLLIFAPLLLVFGLLAWIAEIIESCYANED